MVSSVAFFFPTHLLTTHKQVVSRYVVKKPLLTYKPSTYLLITYFHTYLPIYETYFPTQLVTKVKWNINSVEVHLQLSNNEHPVDGELVGVGSLWPGRYVLRASPAVLFFLASIFKPSEIHLKSSRTPHTFYWKIEHYKLRDYLTFPTWPNYYHQLVSKKQSFRFIPALHYLKQT
jgi:hypothetical protein